MPTFDGSTTEVNMELSKHDPGSMARYLDRAEVLHSTVEQLRKDLAMDEAVLPAPVVGEGAFEELRGKVLFRLQALQDQGSASIQQAMYRVDIPEAHLRRTMASGGLHALAGECVLRALQKVLTRLRYAGRF